MYLNLILLEIDDYTQLGIGLTVLILLGAIVYIVPTVIAFIKHHKYKWIIFVINLLAGWTGIAWVVAFVWAVWPAKTLLVDPLGDPSGKGGMPTETGKRVSDFKNNANPNNTDREDRLLKLFELKEKGAITEKEYIKMKLEIFN